MTQPEFDRYSASYDELLHDPVRTRFAGGGSQFFHRRKRDLIRQYFRSRRMDTRKLRYLDVGCGKGELVTLLRGDFAFTAACDPSSTMLSSVEGIATRVQHDPVVIPFDDASFDFITAVCVYHHVPPQDRLAMTHEVRRVLSPGGVFAIIEHNPANPVTRLIVSRTPVDESAVLLKRREAQHWMQQAGFTVDLATYFLFLPELLYKQGLAGVENALAKLPLGGQYAVFATKRAAVSLH